MSEKWNNILIEWVNSLKLGKPLKKLAELRNGEFFLNLQQIITKSLKSDTDILTFIFELLAKHYPNYVIDNVSQVHHSDLPLDELSSITSLLLHYICIYDRKDVLISPMCYSLSEQTQLSIKSFLQKCNKTVTNADLHDVIEQCTNYVEFNSPLQDLLRTPSRFHEKDRELCKLKSQLEVERDEKNDLLDEIKNHQEKITKLNRNLQRKDLELLKLRNEAENPNKSLHDRSLSRNDSEKLLKCELESLEQYIGKCETELSELKAKNEQLDKMSQKLRLESVDWQEKFLQADMRLQQVERQSGEQKVVINGLKTHCNELEELLSELRSCKNESFEESFRYSRRSIENVVVDEDLARSVVEVQLKELQEAYDALRGELNEKAGICEQLQAANGELLAKIEGIEERNEELQVVKESLLRDLEKMKRENANLVIECEKQSVEIETYSEVNGKLHSDIGELTETVENIKRNLCAKESEFKELKIKYDKDVKGLQTALKCEMDSLEAMNRRFDDVEEKCDGLEVANSILIGENLAYCQQIKELNVFNENLSQKINELQTGLEEVEGIKRTLEEELKANRIKHDLENNELKNDLICKKNEVDVLNCQLTDMIGRCNELEARINDLKAENATCCKNIEEITLNNENLCEKINGLGSNLEKIKKINMELEKELKERKIKYDFEIVELKKCKEEEVGVLNSQLTDSNNQCGNLSAKNRDLEVENATFSKEIEQITLNYGNLVEKVNGLETELENVEKIKHVLEEEMKENQIKRDMEINELRNHLNCKIKELEVLNCRLSDVINQCEHLKALSGDLHETNVKYCKEIEQITSNNELLNEKIKELKLVIENKDKINHVQAEELKSWEIKYENEVKELNCILKSKDEDIYIVNRQLTDNNIENDKLLRIIHELKEEIALDEEKVEYEKKANNMFSEKIRELQETIENIKKIRIEKEEELIENQKLYNVNLEELNNCLKGKKEELEVLNNQFSHCNSECDELKSTISKLNEEIVEHHNDIENITHKNQSQSEQITSLRENALQKENELIELKNKYDTDLNELKSIISNEQETSTAKSSEIKELKTEIEQIQLKTKSLLNENMEYCNKIEQVGKLNETQHEDILKLKEAISVSEKNCKRQNVVIKENQTQLQNCRDELAAKENQIQSLNSDLERINGELKHKNSTFQLQETNLFNLTNKINELNVQMENFKENEQTLHENYKVEVDALKSAQNSSDSTIKQLEETNRGLETLKNELTLKNADLDIQVMEVDLKIVKYREEIENLNKQITECKQVNEETIKLHSNEKDILIANFESQINELTLVNQTQQQEIERVKTINTELEITKQDSIKKYEELKSTVSTLVNEANKYNSQIEKMKAINEELTKTNEELTKNHLTEKQSIVNELNALKTQQQLVIENLEKEKHEVLAKHSNLIEDKQKANEELSKSYEKELKEFTNQLLHLTTKNNELFTEHKQNLEQIDELRQDLFNVRQNNQQLEQEIEEKDMQYVELNDQFCEYKTESSQQIEDLTNNIHNVVEKYNILKSDYENLEKKQNTNAESLRDELVACSEQISSDLSKIQSLTNDKDQLEQMVNYYKNELDRVKKDRNQIIESQTKIMKETENNILKIHEQEQNQRQAIEKDLEKIREAYGNVMSENSKLEMDNLKLRKKLEEKLSEVGNYQHVKEAYEKLLEENNQFMIEVDTLQLKRSKDREEYVRLLKKEREEADGRESEIVKKIRLEYEEKLDKMKEKMLKLYREELDKELKKVESGKQESAQLRTTINDLRNELFNAEQKITTLERDLELTHRQSIRESRESIQSLQDHKLRTTSDRSRFTLSRDDFKMHSARSLATTRETVHAKQDRRFTSTLPRTGVPPIASYEETITTTTSRRTSLLPLQTQNIEMEDEEESCLFNEKYVSDLKAGRCKVQQQIAANGESNASRYSELAWRNSLVPAHLKSSYPLETQFVSPTRFKEDDLKSGNVGLDDSLSKLLPGEKARQRKDFGTTSYKRPGPPTPSKNGGRLSLQGNEVHPLREHNTEHPKRATPNRLKDLFKRSNVSRDNSENQSTTPRARRLSNIFRKPK